MVQKSKLQRALALTKNIIIGGAQAPQTVKMPKAVHELHVSPDDVVPAGTIITYEIAQLAGLDDETLGDLLETGAIVLVDVYSSAGVGVENDAEG